MAKNHLTAEYAREALNYDPETGIFTYKVRPREHFSTTRVWKIFNTQFSGTRAGYVDRQGYRIIRNLNGQRCPEHRLAFLIQTGSFPPEETDHINGIRDDNRWCNLRPVTFAENRRNVKRYANNNSGHIGVRWYPPLSKWLARIAHKGKRIHLGYYDTKEEAIQARREAEVQFGYHPNHGR